MTATVRLADSPELLKQAFDLRVRVFGDEQGYDPEYEVDYLDGVAVPFVLVGSSERVLAVLRLIPYPVPDVPERIAGMQRWDAEKLPGAGRTETDFAATLKAQMQLTQREDGVCFSGVKVGRVAVDKSLRGTGCGRQLMEAAEAWLLKVVSSMPEARGACKIQLQLESQVIAAKFYEKLGYVPASGVYILEGEPHMLYVKTLTTQCFSGA